MQDKRQKQNIESPWYLEIAVFLTSFSAYKGQPYLQTNERLALLKPEQNNKRIKKKLLARQDFGHMPLIKKSIYLNFKHAGENVMGIYHQSSLWAPTDCTILIFLDSFLFWNDSVKKVDLIKTQNKFKIYGIDPPSVLTCILYLVFSLLLVDEQMKKRKRIRYFYLLEWESVIRLWGC